MSSSEAEVDISVVSSPEPSPLGAAARDSPLLARSPTRSADGSSPPATPTHRSNTPNTAAGTPTTSASGGNHFHHSPSGGAVPPAVLHHHLQHHLSSLGGHPVALHHALHTFGHLHPAHGATHPALLQHALTPTGQQQQQQLQVQQQHQQSHVERLSPPMKSPERNGGDEVQGHSLNNNNSKALNHNNTCASAAAAAAAAAVAAANLSNNSNDSNGSSGGGGGKSTTGSNGFTSFSISSILSRSEPAKKNGAAGLITPIPQLPQPGAGGPQDAAMLSR